MSDTQRGLYAKYEVHRIVGDHLERVQEFCFVLKPDSDPIALDALKLYAAMAHLHGYEKLAEDLMKVVWDIEGPEHAEEELEWTPRENVEAILQVGDAAIPGKSDGRPPIAPVDPPPPPHQPYA